MNSIRVRNLLFGIVILTVACFVAGEESPRVRALSARLLCNCGCGEHLADCSHKQCERKPALREEISAAIDQGKTDDQIMDMLAEKHGKDILLAPRFRGFDTMLWLVPALGALVAVGFTYRLQKRRN